MQTRMRKPVARGVSLPPPFPYEAAAGRRGGRVRNHRMLREGKPELVLAFPGHTSTANMIEIARDAGVKVVVAWSRPASLH
ncbi:conserved hypothetical protein [Cupriavidus taiwanensis LMG 19424]|uniref:Uncharacterized protein n=1 Tax=Cupriavidus taiwanensis (strain DSM 17343 / BCRC 17206 / CCUG 44338 / CIP 107171 / LMG 19424 / R1) TaxID=977880 RepID=B3R9I9_CUPTR|nr:conserved hypothetical protein [Cupriavidus taiwanensis LMG 19424]